MVYSENPLFSEKSPLDYSIIYCRFFYNLGCETFQIALIELNFPEKPIRNQTLKLRQIGLVNSWYDGLSRLPR